jgi:hypothetical protein
MSKAFTAAAVALLIADFAHGRNATALPAGVAELSWRTKVKDVLPELQLYDRCASEHVSIQDMLAHLTGVSGFVEQPERTRCSVLKCVEAGIHCRTQTRTRGQTLSRACNCCVRHSNCASSGTTTT